MLIAAHRDCSCQARRLDARKRPHAFERAFHKLMRLILVVARQVRIHGDVECMLGVKAKSDRWTFNRLRRKSPATISSVTEPPTWDITRILRRRYPLGGHGARALVEEFV